MLGDRGAVGAGEWMYLPCPWQILPESSPSQTPLKVLLPSLISQHREAVCPVPCPRAVEI